MAGQLMGEECMRTHSFRIPRYVICRDSQALVTQSIEPDVVHDPREDPRIIIVEFMARTSNVGHGQALQMDAAKHINGVFHRISNIMTDQSGHVHVV